MDLCRLGNSGSDISIEQKILQINVKEGDYVTKGQVLAVLDGTDIQNDGLIGCQDRLELSKLTMEDGIKQQQIHDYALR